MNLPVNKNSIQVNLFNKTVMNHTGFSAYGF